MLPSSRVSDVRRTITVSPVEAEVTCVAMANLVSPTSTDVSVEPPLAEPSVASSVEQAVASVAKAARAKMLFEKLIFFMLLNF